MGVQYPKDGHGISDIPILPMAVPSKYKTWLVLCGVYQND
jgi:hypothetical protein